MLFDGGCFQRACVRSNNVRERRLVLQWQESRRQRLNMTQQAKVIVSRGKSIQS